MKLPKALRQKFDNRTLERRREVAEKMKPGRPDWRSILGARDNIRAAEMAYRVLAKTAHPDTPTGSHEAMAELNDAIEQARKELGA